ncbi:uncharacterized protein LOC142336974 [Convolutriloba macropyga]|uniref:uncharacterized protein LOC142336974 n=1 Tax=Convolutriloba macropyga TaxID=536237 RepID=UPI003F527020
MSALNIVGLQLERKSSLSDSSYSDSESALEVVPKENPVSLSMPTAPTFSKPRLKPLLLKRKSAAWAKDMNHFFEEERKARKKERNQYLALGLFVTACTYLNILLAVAITIAKILENNTDWTWVYFLDFTSFDRYFGWLNK